jgi:hypothetical protein
MVFNVTFNNISAISWWSGLLEGKPEYPAKTIDLPQIIDKLYHGIEYTSPWATFELTTLEAIGIDCKGSCNSNYHTSTTAPLHHRRQDNKRANSYYKNIPFSVMLSVLDLSAVYHGFDSWLDQTRFILICVASSLSIHH